jgi:hypothetical protein
MSRETLPAILAIMAVCRGRPQGDAAGEAGKVLIALDYFGTLTDGGGPTMDKSAIQQ